MERVTIDSAIHELEDVLVSLDNAYWEACKSSHKDTFYDLISIFHAELNELAKLSINDHYMAYEPITYQLRNASIKLRDLQSNLPTYVLRSKTAEALGEQLPEVIKMISVVS